MARMGGSTYQQAPVLVRRAKVKVPWFVGLAVWVGRRLAATALWATRHPVAVLAAVMAVTGWWITAAHGPAPVLTAGLTVLAVLAGWSRLHPTSFARLVLWRLRAAWRAAAVYRRLWQPAMVTAPLYAMVEGTLYLPRLVSLRCTGGVDVARVRMLPGMTLSQPPRRPHAAFVGDPAQLSGPMAKAIHGKGSGSCARTYVTAPTTARHLPRRPNAPNIIAGRDWLTQAETAS